MGYKTVELTLMSAKDLKNVNLIGKMDVYVVVFLSSDPRSKQKTPVHQDGGTCPRWNHTVQFTVDDSAPGLMVVFQLKHQHTFGADKDLGEVRIPVKDLIAAFRNTKDAQIATYQVRRPSGNPKGELKLSYKVNDVVYGRNQQQQQQAPVTAYPLQPSSSVYPPPPPPTAYPAPPPVTRYPPQATPYPAPPPYGYGYPVQMMQQQPQRVRRNGGLGMGMGAGLLGGALGGLLIGDVISDSYGGGGYGGGGYDGGGYDGGGYDGGGGFDGGDMDF